VACCRTKEAISLKCVKIEEQLLWTAYRNSPTLFRTVPSLTPYGLPFPKIGVRNPHPKLQSKISGKQLLIQKSCVWGAYRNSPTLFRMVPSSTSYSLPFPKIGGLQLIYPLLSQEQVKLQTLNLAGAFTGPIQVKARSKFRRKWSVGVSRDCPNFWVPPIISGKGKATDFKFCMNIHRVDRNKSP